MGFEARLNLPEREPPVRAYVHEAGFRGVYGARVDNAVKYLLRVLDRNPEEYKKYNFILATLWGEKGSMITERIIDFHAVSGLEDDWSSNPEVSLWVVRNDLYTPETGICTPSTSKTCEDSMIVFGREGEYRRNTRNLREYAENPPHLGALEPKIDAKF